MSYQVLIVEDEEIVCRGLTEFVKWKEHGFEVAGTAGDVDDALALLKVLPVNVIFLDIRMPRKTGLTMLPVLKENYPEIRTVILSGYSDFSYAKEALRYGVRDYLTKPVNIAEIETLLDHLREELNQQQRKLQIQTARMHALLLSIAKGYTKAEPQTHILPVLQGWFGLSMSLPDKRLSEEELMEKKRSMEKQLASIFSRAIVLDSDVFSLFFIIPCEGEKDLEVFISLMERMCPQLNEWACGVSGYKKGIQELPGAWREAEKALGYHRGNARKGITRYSTVKNLMAQDLPELDALLAQTIVRLTDPSRRTEAVSCIREFLLSVLKRNDGLADYQTMCIRFVYELNGRLNNLNTPEVDFQPHIDMSISRLLLCENHQDIVNCMMDHVKWIVQQFERLDEHQLAKGIIWKVQLYIRQHYQEDISLNSLSEHFYLHPNYLSMLFKDKTGSTFIKYLTEVRIEKAKQLLQNTDYNIMEVSTMIGYRNPRYFSRLFKSYTGMRPGEFRQGR